MAIVVFLFFLLVGLWLASEHPRKAMLLSVAFIPWSALGVDVGVNVNVSLVFLFGLFVVNLFALWKKIRNGKRIAVGLFEVLASYAVISSMLQVFILPEAQLSGSFFRQPMVRAFAQIFMFLLVVSPVWIFKKYYDRVEEIVMLFRVYVLSCIVLAIFGWMQIAVLLATGSDPFPIGFISKYIGGYDGSDRTGVFAYMGANMYRMSSLGGEPKGFGISLVLALLIIQAGGVVRFKYRQWIWLFLLLSLIASFSTSAILSWFLVSVIQVVFFRSFSLRSGFRVKISDAYAYGLFLIVTSFLFIVINQRVSLIDLVKYRTIDRIESREDGVMEEYDTAVYDFLLDKPLWLLIGTGLGNAHLYASDYLPEYSLYYTQGTVFVAKKGVLRWISELGFVGLAFFAFYILFLLQALRIKAMNTRGFKAYSKFSISVLLASFFLWSISGYVQQQLFYFIGLVMCFLVPPDDDRFDFIDVEKCSE